MRLSNLKTSNERWLVAGLTTAFIGFGYFSADLANIHFSHTSGRIVNLKSELDSLIPFVPLFVIPYCSYYFYPTLFPFIVRSRTMLYQAAFTLIILQIAATTTFLAIPSHIERPLINGDSLIHDMVRVIYKMDSGYNLLPSLHVAHSTIFTIISFVTGTWFRYLILGSTILICCSTVLIKQHFIIDVPFGLLYAFISYYLAGNIVKLLAKSLDLTDEEIDEVPINFFPKFRL